MVYTSPFRRIRSACSTDEQDTITMLAAKKKGESFFI
jgi:hypothetical protein